MTQRYVADILTIAIIIQSVCFSLKAEKADRSGLNIWIIIILYVILRLIAAAVA